jgi:arabinose-5-phosphate isomerase
MIGSFSTEQIISWGQGALQDESQALLNASKRLDGNFEKAAKAILGSSGKVILTGMGKSGHVARKVAATLSSTGTSSFYVHPSEALHGDFGMIEKHDVLITIAFGGETREVVEVAKFARRLEVPVVAICGNPKSSLATLSDYFIDGNVEKEACPLNLAPTSSTTVALALGDALAITLMKARGFKEKDFVTFHPEGSLGRRLSTVSDHLRPVNILPYLEIGDEIHTILKNVTDNNFGIAVVLSDEKELLGVITDGDLRRAMLNHEAEVFHMKAGDLMSKYPQ